MKLILQRKPTAQDWMLGDLYIVDEGGKFLWECYTLEDELREQKVMHETAIETGLYNIVLEDSPRFGPDTITLKGVKNFTHIRIHGGNDDDDTSGCIIVGDRIDERTGRIGGGTLHGVLDALKNRLREALARGEELTLEVRNAPGDRYVDTGALAALPA